MNKIIEKIKTKNFNFNKDEKEIIKENLNLLLELLKEIKETNINNDIIDIIKNIDNTNITDEIITYLIPLTTIINDINNKKELQKGIINPDKCDNEVIKNYIEKQKENIKKLYKRRNIRTNNKRISI